VKIVAISQRMDPCPDRPEVRDAVDQRLNNFLIAAGLIPVPIPNTLINEASESRRDHEVLDAWLAAVKPQAFVLSGGNDIGQCAERDWTERRLLDHASLQMLPILGICRGMQMMAHWAGTGLHPAEGHVGTRHCLSGDVTGEVNSYHWLSISSCPEKFEVLARSEDGEIEAIRHRSLPWEGWMWHPERESIFFSRDVQRVRDLFGR